MPTETHTKEIAVKVVYPSAHHPAEKEFSPSATLREVKQFALDTFGLKEGNVDGQQVVYFLYLHHSKIENLDQRLSAILPPHEHEVTFRLAKEVIAG
jgi:hypothetical protein